MLEHTAPRFSVTEASLLAREHFGLEGHATALPSHLDQISGLTLRQDGLY